MFRSGREDTFDDIKCGIDLPNSPVQRFVDLDICYIQIERPTFRSGFDHSIASRCHASDILEIFHGHNIPTAVGEDDGDFIGVVFGRETDWWNLIDGPCRPGILQVLEDARITISFLWPSDNP